MKILFVLLLPILFIRLSRWLSIVQQKEYRLDRLLLFLQSQEGIRDLILPWPLSYKRLPTLADLKRPKVTGRIVVVAVTSLIGIGLWIVMVSQWHITFALLFTYIVIPIIVLLAILPTTYLSLGITYITLLQAARKIHKHKPFIIGITGSYGKSSTKLLLSHVLSQQLAVFTTPRSYNTRFSVAKSILSGYQGQPYVILEYGAYTKGEIKTLATWFKPALAIITGITPQHLGLFGSVDEIIKAKSELIKALPQNGVVFSNEEDLSVKHMCHNAKQAVIPYSGSNSSIQLHDVKIDNAGKLSFTWNKQKISTNLVGKHYLNNIQAAMAVALHLHCKPDRIIKSLESFIPNELFIQSKSLKSNALVIDDGKTSNPKGFEAAVHLIKEIPKKRKVLLTEGIIDLGSQSSIIHSQLAKEVSSVFDTVLYSGVEGRDVFIEVMKNKCIVEKKMIINELKTINSDTVLLIEGRIKQDILQAIY